MEVKRMSYSEKELDALVQFRYAIKEQQLYENCIPEDHFLIRWLRARNLDIRKATEMLRHYLVWRRTNKDLKLVLSGTWVYPKIISDHLKYKITGFDYEGRPIIWTSGGRWELGKLIDGGFRDDIFRFGYQAMEDVMNTFEIQRKIYGDKAGQVNFILDAEGLTFRKVTHLPTIQLRFSFLKEFEAYFPEILHRCYIINAHWVVTYLYNLVRPLLSKHTENKIRMYDKNIDGWKAALLTELPAASLPEDYGGTAPPVLTLYDNQ